MAGRATLADRRLAGHLALASPAIAVKAQGTLDLARSAFDRVTLRADLLQPPALFPNMTGEAIRLEARLDGAFRRAAYAYRLSGRRVVFDARTGFDDVLATGSGRWAGSPVHLPLTLSARRVTGVGEVAGGILANLRVRGTLAITARALTGDGLLLGSDKLTGKLALFVDLVSGRYDVTVSGQLVRYLIPGLGIVDVTTDLKVVPDATGRSSHVEGRAHAQVRRFDNAFLRGLAGGLPTLDTRLVRDRDGILRLTGLRITAPALTLAASGYRRTDGSFVLEGTGAHTTYGPFRLALDGQIDKPRIDLLLARPADALGLADVAVHLDPDPAGFAYTARGGSTLGPFDAAGRIQLPKGAPATILVAALDVTGTRLAGTLRPEDAGGFSGRLDAGGGGIAGPIGFAAPGGVQRIELHLAGADARIAGLPDLALRRGKADAVLMLYPQGSSIEATFAARGLRRGQLSLARADGRLSLRAGRGSFTAALAGSRGRAFALQLGGQVAPDRLALTGKGTIDGRPVALTGPAVIAREGDGWRIAPTGVQFAGGAASVGGRFGGAGGTALDAKLERMPLSVLDIAYPDLGLGGIATGSLVYRLPGGGAAPSGRADLRVRGLTRSGLVLSSQPIDVGVTALLDANGIAARAVMASGGAPIGRAQARLRPLGPGTTLAARIAAAPLFAQLRYQGPADTLWRLTGIETIDLSGPVAIGADVTGRIGDPQIRGSLRTDAARLESALTGTVITNLKANGRFGGSRLAIDSFTGIAGKGSVTGRANFDLAAAHGFGMDIALDASGANLLNRDDIGAVVTGPLTIRSDGAGGIVGGDVRLDQSRFRLGSAAAAAIPRLNVREINLPDAEAPGSAAPPSPWRFDLKTKARNRLMVTGLGLDSEWKATLTIKGTVDNPAIGGRADLVRGGYEFAGRRFDIDHGAIRFTGDAPPDPVLDIVADADIQGLSATIRVGGTGQKPQISFQSVPQLPEDELLSRLLFGSSIASLSAPEALQLAAAVASLQNGGAGGLNPINAVRRAAGLDRLRILPADPVLGIGTAVAAGKYVTRRTYVELVTDGQGYSATNLEFQVTRWLSLLSTISTIGRQSANVRVSKDY